MSSSSSRLVSLNSEVFSNPSSKGTPVSKGGNSQTVSSSSRLQIQELVSKIESMRHLSGVPVENLDKKKQQELKDLRQVAMLLRKGKNYTLVVDAIKRTFGSNTDLQASTVGAFFHGCFIDNDSEECLACSALCAGSMPVPAVPGWKDCDKNVGVYTNGSLAINYVTESSKEILIHVVEGEFSGLSEEESKRLKKMGIEKVTVSSSDSRSRSSSSFSTITGTPDSVCRKSSVSSERSSETYYPTQRHSTSSQSSYSQQNTSSDWSWGLIAAVIILLLILFLAAIAYYYWGSAKTESAPTKDFESSTTSESFFSPGYY